MTNESHVDETPKPSQEEVESLRHLVSGIVTAQGNIFIKELLREQGIRIGTTKADFTRNMWEAIDTGTLTSPIVEAWLHQVEGWGDQHVYLYHIPPGLKPGLTGDEITGKATVAGLQDLLGASTAMKFPDKPELTSIQVGKNGFSLIWHEASPTWSREPDFDFRWPEATPTGVRIPKLEVEKQDSLDDYEFRAFRRLERRAVTRFEVRLDLSLAALFIPEPIKGKEHRDAIAAAEEVLAKLLDLGELHRARVPIADVSKNLDQANLPQRTRGPVAVKVQRSRLDAGGAYVEFAASEEGHSYWDSREVGNVRRSVRPDQLLSFSGTKGVFELQKDGLAGIKRNLRVQLYGRDRRIRLWAQMDRDEVWSILAFLSQYGKAAVPAPSSKQPRSAA